MLAHELRNPVTIGQIYSQQLPAESESEAVEYVTEAFDRIEEMIDVMLVLTRGREAVGERTPIDLASMAREVWDDVDAPEATLDVEIDRTIRADETYVRHLFRNLFDNAVQHGGEDATVMVSDLPIVSASSEGRSPSDRSSGQSPREDDASGGSEDEQRESADGFYVADDGPGIPSEDRERVFEGGYSTDPDGTGFGLAIVRRIAEAHDWQIRITESDEGGARFEFSDVDEEERSSGPRPSGG
jgi:signal transduction histidine kinase